MEKIALIGRPNVGKSTLFNRLVGKKLAIVHDQPGVTRDRRYGNAALGPSNFEIIDTPGLEEADKDTLEKLMTEQSLLAMEEADVVLFIMDAKQGLTPQDQHFAMLARKSGKPIILVANKAEAKSAKDGMIEATELGFGEPVPISAEHGVGMSDLYEAMVPYLSAEEDVEEEINNDLQVTIIGRPNAGKSTLMNELLGEDRMLTGPMAGMTRDAIAVDFDYNGRPIKLVDTAGMRKRAKITEGLEKLSVSDATRSIKYAHITILVLDATQILERQDTVIASLVEREGRACVIAVNKWDEITDRPELLLDDIKQRLLDVAPKMKGIPVIPISALKGKGIDKLMDAVFSIYDIWNTRVKTGELNRWLEAITTHHTPPLVKGRRIKIRYITQAKSRPPTFILFVSRKGLPEHYIQYLRNNLRETFHMPGVPIRLILRTGKNPYVEKE